MNKKQKFLVCAVALIIFFIIDWGFLKSEITHYEVICLGEIVDHNCKGKFSVGVDFTYKVDKKTQVVYFMGDRISEYNKCVVVDRKNWTCDWEGSTSKFGFSNGKFWDNYGLNEKDSTLPLRAKSQTVSRLNYLLVKWLGFDGFIDKFLVDHMFLTEMKEYE